MLRTDTKEAYLREDSQLFAKNIGVANSELPFRGNGPPPLHYGML